MAKIRGFNAISWGFQNCREIYIFVFLKHSFVRILSSFVKLVPETIYILLASDQWEHDFFFKKLPFILGVGGNYTYLLL